MLGGKGGVPRPPNAAEGVMIICSAEHWQRMAHSLRRLAEASWELQEVCQQARWQSLSTPMALRTFQFHDMPMGSLMHRALWIQMRIAREVEFLEVLHGVDGLGTPPHAPPAVRRRRRRTRTRTRSRSPSLSRTARGSEG